MASATGLAAAAIIILTGDLGVHRAVAAAFVAVGLGTAPFVTPRWLAPVPIAIGASLAPTAPIWAVLLLTGLTLVGVTAHPGPWRHHIALSVAVGAGGGSLLVLASMFPRSAEMTHAPFAAAASGTLLLAALAVSYARRTPAEGPP